MLEQLRVVALEQAVAAPLCTRRLAQAGAEIIKIERPEGDFARFYDSAVVGESTYFAQQWSCVWLCIPSNLDLDVDNTDINLLQATAKTDTVIKLLNGFNTDSQHQISFTLTAAWSSTSFRITWASVCGES